MSKDYIKETIMNLCDDCIIEEKRHVLMGLTLYGEKYIYDIIARKNNTAQIAAPVFVTNIDNYYKH